MYIAHGIAPQPFSLRRVSKQEPCPICDHPDWCETRSDGAVHCMRIESAIPSSRSGGWWHRFSTLPGAGEHDQIKHLQHAPGNQEHETPRLIVVASPADRNRVYRELLVACRLLPHHVSYLASEGFTGVHLALYGSLHSQRVQIANHLQRRFSNDLLVTIPGLYLRADGCLAVASPDGLLVATTNIDGDIVALQCRVQSGEGSKKYLWLSSAGHNGPASGAPCHVLTQPEPVSLWITEGAKKAHAVTLYKQVTALGMPGHANQADTLQVIDLLVAQGALQAVIALDEDTDISVSTAVETSRQKLLAACRDRGLAVRVARWDPADGKGIDDLLRAGKEPTITIPGPPVPPPGLKMQVGTGSCQCTEAQGFRTLQRILQGPLPDTEKLSTMGLASVLGEASLDKRDVYIDDVVQAAGMTSTRSPETARKRVGQALLNAAELMPALQRWSTRDPITEHMHNQYALNPALLPLPGSALAIPSRKVKDSQRKKLCKGCGSAVFKVTCVCCGLVQDSFLEDVLASGEGVHNVDTGNKEATIQEHGHILASEGRNFRNPPSVSIVVADSGNGSQCHTGGSASPLVEPVRRNPLTEVMDILTHIPEGLPRDWIELYTDMTYEEIRQGITIGLKNGRIVELPAREKNGAPVYAVKALQTARDAQPTTPALTQTDRVGRAL